MNRLNSGTNPDSRSRRYGLARRRSIASVLTCMPGTRPENVPAAAPMRHM